MRLREKADKVRKKIRKDLYTLYFAYRHPKTPWYARVIIGLTVAYALSPIDLIPDFIPVIGYLDDLIIVPAGISLSLRLIPDSVISECRERADNERISGRLRWGVAAIIILFWSVVAYIGIRFMLDLYSG